MKQLLALYIPKTTKLYIGFIAITFLTVFAAGLLPVDKISIEVLRAFIIFLPSVVFYFASETYLPNSLNWILLTPLSKKSILSANIIINLYKVILITTGSFLLSAYAYNFDLVTFFSRIAEFFLSIEGKDLQILQTVRFSSTSYFVIIGILSIFFSMISFLFFAGSWVPNYASVSFVSHPIKYITRNAHWFLILLFLYFFFSDSQAAHYLFPTVIKYPATLSIGLYIGVTSTLSSLRAYYSKSTLRILMAALFILNSSTFYFLIKRDIRDAADINSKIGYMNALGPIASGRDGIIKELKAENSNLDSLESNELQIFLDHSQVEADAIHSVWINRCKKNKDQSCRYSTYLLKSDQKHNQFSLLEMGCVNDLESCYLLYTLKRTPNDVITRAKTRLESECTPGKPQATICRKYHQAKY